MDTRQWLNLNAAWWATSKQLSPTLGLRGGYFSLITLHYTLAMQQNTQLLVPWKTATFD